MSTRLETEDVPSWYSNYRRAQTGWRIRRKGVERLWRGGAYFAHQTRLWVVRKRREV